MAIKKRRSKVVRKHVGKVRGTKKGAHAVKGKAWRHPKTGKFMAERPRGRGGKFVKGGRRRAKKVPAIWSRR